MTDKPKTDLVPVRQNLPSASTGGRKILSTVMADALVIAKGLGTENKSAEFTSGIYEGEWRDGKPNGQGRRFRYAGFDKRLPGLVALGTAQGFITTKDIDWHFPEATPEVKQAAIDAIKGDSFLKFKVLKRNSRSKPRAWLWVDCLEGEWVDGSIQCGVFMGVTHKYEGTIRLFRPHGKGKTTWWSGKVYEGHYVDGKRHGKGKWTHPDGDLYEGDWVAGEEHGKGKMLYMPSGEVYEGDWVEGNKHGKGKYTWPDGQVYEGDWVDDKRHGKGKHTWPSGHIYQGDWQSGLKHGKGKMIHIGGAVYAGDWADDERHGKGRVTNSDGSTKYGTWVKGEYQSK